jgi:hypothetical protein
MDVVVIWVSAPCILMVGNQCSGFFITNFHPADGSSTASETSVSNQQTLRRNSPDHHDFYYTLVFCISAVDDELD